MADSLRAVLDDMGSMLPRRDDYHPIYVRIQALVDGGENVSTAVRPLSRYEAMRLPKDSIIIQCDHNGVPRSVANPVKTDGPDHTFLTGNLYRVLYRAPKVPLTVGEKINDKDRLEEAEDGTIVQTLPTGAGVFRKRHGRWYGTGIEQARDASEVVIPGVEVVYVPKGDD